jgi:hypothetical protein
VLPLMALMVSFASCGLGEVTVPMGVEFSLSVGQKASIAGGDLRVEFVDVVADSRCPKDVVCVWAGEVKCLVELVSAGSAERVEFTQPGLTSDPSRQAFKGYDFSFTVAPYPEAGQQISRGDYRLKLTVRREASG